MNTLKINKILTLNFMIISFLVSCKQDKKDIKIHNEVSEKINIEKRWSQEKANQWGNNLPWLRGSNFNPSTSINQLEFWQKETFDLETIERELGWAQDIGLNAMRVYLHHLAWEVDKSGFKNSF